MVGRSRQERLYKVGGPSQSKGSHVDVVAIASEPSWMHNAHSTRDNSQNYRIIELSSHSHGDRPQMAIAGAHRTCHINVGQMYEEDHYTTFPTPMSHVRIEAENA